MFLEYDVDNPKGDRDSRWWAAHESGGIVFLPLIMVDSGHRITNGVEDFYDKYQRLVQAELRHPALARLKVIRERIDTRVHFVIRITNLEANAEGVFDDLRSGENATTQSFTRRSRSAFPMTDTELKLIATAAIIGESRIPKKGYSAPAATGTPTEL